jgi:hypothetical protein
LPIAYDGTGNGNASEYYLRRDDGWKQIEADRWLDDFARQIPAGTELRKGVWPDLHSMTAQTGLYREGDANCCPSGGTARVSLTLRDAALTLSVVAIEPP